MTDAEQPKPKSLWDVMRHGEDAAGQQSPPPPVDPPSEIPADSGCDQTDGADGAASPDETRPLKSLWQTMAGPDASAATGAMPAVEEDSASRSAAMPSTESISPSTFAFDEEAEETFHYGAEVPHGISRTACLCAALGIASLAASGAIHFEVLWAKVPAMLCGLVALVCGMLAWEDIRRSEGLLTGKPLIVLGMICGLAGMFVGPIFFLE